MAIDPIYLAQGALNKVSNAMIDDKTFVMQASLPGAQCQPRHFPLC